MYEQWEKIEEALEDLAMYLSKKLQHNIRRARAEVRKGQVLTFEEVQKKLGLAYGGLFSIFRERRSSFSV